MIGGPQIEPQHEAQVGADIPLQIGDGSLRDLVGIASRQTGAEHASERTRQRGVDAIAIPVDAIGRQRHLLGIGELIAGGNARRRAHRDRDGIGADEAQPIGRLGIENTGRRDDVFARRAKLRTAILCAQPHRLACRGKTAQCAAEVDQVPIHVGGDTDAGIARADRTLHTERAPARAREQPESALHHVHVALGLRFERYCVGQAQPIEGARQIIIGAIGALAVGQVGADAAADRPFRFSRSQHFGVGKHIEVERAPLAAIVGDDEFDIVGAGREWKIANIVIAGIEAQALTDRAVDDDFDIGRPLDGDGAAARRTQALARRQFARRHFQRRAQHVVGALEAARRLIDIADVEAHLLVGKIIDQPRGASLEAGFVLVDTHGDERALHGVDRALVGDVVLEHDAGHPHCRLQAEVEADHAGPFPAIIGAAGDVDEARDRRRRHEVAAAHAPRLRKAQIVAGALLDSWIKCQLHLIGIVGQPEIGAA